MDKFKELLKLQEEIRTDIEAEPEADAMRKRDALDNMLEKMTECLLAELSKEDRDFLSALFNIRSFTHDV